ncbi:ABC transporter ATP-binding protein [Metabacillus halosaccharovorans]|uniref:ABC transporter ATP-binding protein n=1 Tax=Metabacillus halosaccharovorans TaxID=930124 RepID=UPI0034CF5157
MNDIVIKLKNVGKQYPGEATKLLTLKNRLLKKSNNLEGQWSVKNVTLDINSGDSLAILGDNGSGKSTLLKLILGVTSPTTGSIAIKGKIGGLIELGAGFHKELSGRENIYMNGVVLGLKEKEIDNIIDDIIEFAELREHIDKPIKQYSSGMKVRLGFSIAIHVDADIILLDEVLAVGDKRFKQKAMEAIRSYLKDKTIIFVSHSTNQVRKLCEKGIVLNKGKVVFSGEINAAIDFYEREIVQKTVIK